MSVMFGRIRRDQRGLSEIVSASVRMSYNILVEIEYRKEGRGCMASQEPNTC